MFARNQVVYLLVLCFSTCRVLTNLKTDKLEMTQNYMLFFPTVFFSSCISLITILKLNKLELFTRKQKNKQTHCLFSVFGVLHLGDNEIGIEQTLGSFTRNHRSVLLFVFWKTPSCIMPE